MEIQNAIDYFKNYIEFCKESEIGAPTLEPYEIAIEAMESLATSTNEQTRIISMNSTINIQEVELRLCRAEIRRLNQKVIDLLEENLSLRMELKDSTNKNVN